MRPWIGGGTPIWPPTWTEWQIYLLPDLEADTDLADLISRCDAVVCARRRWWQRRTLAVVPRRWLHLTVLPLPGAAAAWSQPQLDRLVTALRAELAGFGSLEAHLGPPLCGSSGVMLDVDTDGARGRRWHELYARVHAATQGVLGPTDVTDVPDPSWPPHLAVAYCRRAADSGPVSSQLRRIRPARARARFRHAWLVEVVQDPQRHQYRWRRSYVLPLTQPASAVSSAAAGAISSR